MSARAHSNDRSPLGTRTVACGAMWIVASIFAAMNSGIVSAQSPQHLNFPLRLADSAPDWMVRLDTPAGCLASIPRASMHRVPVFLNAMVPEHDDTVITLQTDLLAQDVSDELRRLLGARGNDVPTADSLFAWHSVPTELMVIAYRHGTMNARARISTGDSAATALLGHAFENVRNRGLARIIWPDRLKADSILVRLRLWPAYVGQSSSVEFGTWRQFAAFYLTEPERSPPVPLPDQDTPSYPLENRWNQIEGYVLMQFIVDSTGRVDANSVHDLWPAGKRRLAGESLSAYNDFVHAVRVWQTRMRYTPARIGPCAVRELQRLPVMFKFRPR